MSTLRLTTISNQTGSASVPSDTVINGSAKAWVNFNGTGTVAIRASFNVSSITDNGTGDYTVNFTTAMVDANYCVTTSNKYDDANTSFANGVTVVARYTTAFQTGSVRVQTGINALTDTVAVCVAIFR